MSMRSLVNNWPTPTSGTSKALRRCAALPIPGARADLHLESDPWRGPWFEAVTAFIADKADASRAVAIPHEAPASPVNSEASDEDTAHQH